MATATANGTIERIGATAGEIWRCLNDNGPMSLAKLTKQVGVPRDSVMQAVGWLAREDKVEIEERNRTRIIFLK